MDKDKSTTRDPDGDQTSMRAWSITRWTSLSTQKWSSNLGLDHGGLVNLIIHDNFLLHIDTLLEKIFEKRGENEGPPNKGGFINIPHQKNSLTQQGI